MREGGIELVCCDFETKAMNRRVWRRRGGGDCEALWAAMGLLLGAGSVGWV